MYSDATSEKPRWLTSGVLIDGVNHRFLDAKRDKRGSFTEIFYDTWETGIHPRQWGVVNSNAGVLRGMHLHLEHNEYICVLQGRACIGLYDLRRESKTYRSHALIDVDGDCPAYITFPRGILHGWYFHKPSIHVQAISNTFDEYGDKDNWGCSFADPNLGIPWPNPNPILSDRATHFPSLRELEGILDAYQVAKESGHTPSEGLTRYADTAVTNIKG
jgi:dTDP-4-dehydrorhamnose 3,5-epimerase